MHTVAVRWFQRAVTASPRVFVAPRSDDGEPFLVSGVTHRHPNLARARVGPKQFLLVRDVGNPHDPYAVKVMDGRVQIGFITAKNARRYWQAIERVEATGRSVRVHGEIERTRDGAFIASIDCCWPEDII